MKAEEKKYIGRFEIDELAYVKKGYRPLTAISLFSGCGGAALGISQAGFHVRVFVEWEKAACETLRCNWTKKGIQEIHEGYLKVNAERKNAGKKAIMPKHLKGKREPVILNADITKLSTKEILEAADLRVGECSLLEGGFPCQGFSMANGNRDNNDYSKDKRNFLYKEALRVISEALPKSFFLENVPGLISMEKGRIIRMICDDLAKAGYDITWDIHDAADYGVPQHRKRVFIIGTRNDVMVFTNDVPQLHIGGAQGNIKHPDWFLKHKKYRMQRQTSLF